MIYLKYLELYTFHLRIYEVQDDYRLERCIYSRLRKNSKLYKRTVDWSYTNWDSNDDRYFEIEILTREQLDGLIFAEKL